MLELRTSSRDLKRAILLDRTAEFAPRASALLDAARGLDELDAGPAFTGRSNELTARARLIVSALGSGEIERIQALFSDAMGACMACHSDFRFDRNGN